VPDPDHHHDFGQIGNVPEPVDNIQTAGAQKDLAEFREIVSPIFFCLLTVRPTRDIRRLSGSSRLRGAPSSTSGRLHSYTKLFSNQVVCLFTPSKKECSLTKEVKIVIYLKR
jgi:hypothetical protein